VTSQPRKIAALLVQRVLDQGESLGSLLGAQLARLDDPRQRALAQELVFGTLRWSYRLEALLARLLRKPLKKKDRDLHALLLVGLYQLLILEMPAHAAVSETVEVARQLGKDWAAGMVNGVLRNAQRQSAQPAHAGLIRTGGLSACSRTGRKTGSRSLKRAISAPRWCCV
jgi:16S rRNA (cytosine967-C5)-methyltransferase